MKVYEALADAFVAEGVRTIFGLMGDGDMYWTAALAKRAIIERYDVRHENAGLAMADGWARVTGKVGVCGVTSGPGVAQIATSLLVASRARTPLIVFTGDVGDSSHPQRLDHRRFADATESLYVRVDNPEGAYAGVRRAFALARIESRPVLLDVPREIQMMELDDSDPYETSNALVPPAQRICPDRARLDDAVEIIAASRKPVIIGGRGAIASGAGEPAQRVAQRIGALIATTLLAKGWLIDDEFHAGISGLFTAKSALELLTEADCVIGIGASLNDYTIESGYLYADARFIHIDTEPAVVMGNGKIADCYLQGDAFATVDALDAILAERGIRSTGYRTPEVRAALEAEVDPATFALDPGTVDPRHASLLLDELVPEEMGLVLGLGHFISFPAMLMKRPRAINVVAAQFACIGQGFPNAIGATLAAKVPTVLVEGDASMLMHPQEMDTMARYGIPLLVVILNDEASGAEFHKLRAHGFDPSLAQLRSPDLAAVARAFGCHGVLAQTLETFGDAVREFVANPRPTVIDLRVSRTVVSVPYRRLHFGEIA